MARAPLVAFVAIVVLLSTFSGCADGQTIRINCVTQAATISTVQRTNLVNVLRNMSSVLRGESTRADNNKKK